VPTPLANIPLPIKLRAGVAPMPDDAPMSEVALRYVPAKVIEAIPIMPDIGIGGGASHSSLTGIATDGKVTIGAFELSLNAWPPAARLMLLKWDNCLNEEKTNPDACKGKEEHELMFPKKRKRTAGCGRSG